MVGMRRTRSLRHEGLATIEMALVLPLLLLLTFGVIEYAWLFFKFHEVTNAARQGARVGVTPDATNGEVEAAIKTIMTSDGMATGYTVSYLPAGGVGGLDTGELLTVSVSIPYSRVTLFGLPFVPVPTTLRSSTTMAKEGP